MDSETIRNELVAAAIQRLVERREEQPSLAELSAHLGVSAPHLQRMFSARAGISPKRFLQFLNKEYARALLAESRPVLDAAFSIGLSGGGRLHDLLVECEAVTPGEVNALGAALEIRHGVAETPFGPALFGLTARGVCHLGFLDGPNDAAAAQAALRDAWPKATLYKDDVAAGAMSARMFSGTAGARTPLCAMVRGTNFQIRVWQALLAVPEGRLTTYGDLARRLGNPSAARAVGNAVGANPLAVLIPCHRVIRESGALGGYRWGIGRKAALLASEDAGARREFAP